MSPVGIDIVAFQQAIELALRESHELREWHRCREVKRVSAVHANFGLDQSAFCHSIDGAVCDSYVLVCPGFVNFKISDPTSGRAILSDEVVNVSGTVSIDVAAIRAVALPILRVGEVSARQWFYEMIAVTQRS